MITYRRFLPKDCESVLNFWAGIDGVHLHENGEDTPEAVCAYLERNDGFSFIGEESGTLVGAVLCGHDGRRGFIHHLAVAKKFRHNGIGKELIRLSLEKLREAGIHKCALFVLKENAAGMAFYEATGWTEETIVNTYSKII